MTHQHQRQCSPTTDQSQRTTARGHSYPWPHWLRLLVKVSMIIILLTHCLHATGQTVTTISHQPNQTGTPHTNVRATFHIPGIGRYQHPEPSLRQTNLSHTTDLIDHNQTDEKRLNQKQDAGEASPITIPQQQARDNHDLTISTIAPTNTVNPNIEASIIHFTVTTPQPKQVTNRTTTTQSSADNRLLHESTDPHLSVVEEDQDGETEYYLTEVDEASEEEFSEFTTTPSTTTTYMPERRLTKYNSKKCTKQDLIEYAWRLDEQFWSSFTSESDLNIITRRFRAYRVSRDDFCTPELVYAFLKLDSLINTTLLLDMEELANGLHVHDYNHCRKLFLNQCDKDQNGLLNDREWCFCFDRQTRLCHKKVKEEKRKLLETFKSYKNQLTKSLARELILSTPSPICLIDGSYNTRQCDHHGWCWCVDRRGVEFRGTRRNTRMGPLNSIDCSNYSDPARDELARYTMAMEHPSRAKQYGNVGRAQLEPILSLEEAVEKFPDDQENDIDGEQLSRLDEAKHPIDRLRGDDKNFISRHFNN